MQTIKVRGICCILLLHQSVSQRSRHQAKPAAYFLLAACWAYSLSLKMEAVYFSDVSALFWAMHRAVQKMVYFGVYQF
jgi:hypothetical protein